MGKKTLSDELSVIIPVLNGAGDLARCLKQLEGRAQVIVSDGESVDESALVAEASGARVVTGPPGRGRQMKCGAEIAETPWLLFLHVDSQLPASWQDQVLAHLARGSGPAVFHLRFDAPGWRPRFVAGWANLRSRLFNLPYGDQALLISRELYDQAGGFDDIPLMEDVALVRRLPRITLLPGCITTGADRYERQGWFTRGRRNFWLLLRYFCGARPEELAQNYQRK